VPAGIVTVIPEVPDPVTEDGLKVDQLFDAVSVTVPVKPLRALMVTLEVAEPPVVGTEKVDGLAEIVKSCTFTLTVAEWLRPPLMPVTMMG
jgi:predicted oxidoreductase